MRCCSTCKHAPVEIFKPAIGMADDTDIELQPLLAEGRAGKRWWRWDPEWNRRVARLVYSCLTHLATSMLFGLVTGLCLKTIGQSIAVAVVIIFLGLQVLAYYGYVNVNWSKLGGSLGYSDGKLDIRLWSSACGRIMAWALSCGVLSVLGFTAGFLVGWKLVKLLPI